MRQYASATVTWRAVFQCGRFSGPTGRASPWAGSIGRLAGGCTRHPSKAQRAAARAAPGVPPEQSASGKATEGLPWPTWGAPMAVVVLPCPGSRLLRRDARRTAAGAFTWRSWARSPACRLGTSTSPARTRSASSRESRHAAVASSHSFRCVAYARARASFSARSVVNAASNSCSRRFRAPVKPKSLAKRPGR
jgi:hypothetical protein